MKLDFGKNKGKAIKECETSYLKWLVAHEKQLKVSNRWASRDAKFELERREKATATQETVVVTTKQTIVAKRARKTAKKQEQEEEEEEIVVKTPEQLEEERRDYLEWKATHETKKRIAKPMKKTACFL